MPSEEIFISGVFDMRAVLSGLTSPEVRMALGAVLFPGCQLLGRIGRQPMASAAWAQEW